MISVLIYLLTAFLAALAGAVVILLAHTVLDNWNTYKGIRDLPIAEGFEKPNIKFIEIMNPFKKLPPIKVNVDKTRALDGGTCIAGEKEETEQDEQRRKQRLSEFKQLRYESSQRIAAGINDSKKQRSSADTDIELH